MHLAGWGQATLTVLLWVVKPLPDAVFFAESCNSTLVVTIANGHLASYGQLSDFLMDMAAMRFGQKHEGDSYQNSDGGMLTTVTVRSVGCHCEEETRSLRRRG